MMNNELLKHCRYYKGEEEYEGDSSDLLFWEAEQVYVNLAGTAESADSVKFYRNCGLTDSVANLPIELLASLFEMYCYRSDIAPEVLAQSFEERFLAKYLNKVQKDITANE